MPLQSALPMELPLENGRYKQAAVQTGGTFLKLPSSDGWKLKPLFLGEEMRFRDKCIFNQQLVLKEGFSCKDRVTRFVKLPAQVMLSKWFQNEQFCSYTANNTSERSRLFFILKYLVLTPDASQSVF